MVVESRSANGQQAKARQSKPRPAKDSQTKGRGRAARQAQLIETATQVFYEKGYEAASLKEIADRMGMLKGSLYYYFHSKEDLLFSVLSAVYQEGFAVVNARAIAVRDEVPLTQLAEVLEAHVEHNCRNMVKIAVFFHEFDRLPQQRRREIIGEDHAYHAIFRQLIKSGQNAGAIRPDLDTELAVLSILGSANWVYRWYRLSRTNTPGKVARQLADMAVSSVATAEAWLSFQDHRELVSTKPSGSCA